MKKNRIRVLALCMAVVCLISTVAALGYDLSGDGVTDVWDLQLAVNKGTGQDVKTGALVEALGGKGDELHPNLDGTYEIWSVLGLYNMAEHATKGKSFKLMADIDMKGMDWTPIVFAGTFDGNGHTISNVKVTKDIHSGYYAMGFFGVIAQYTRSGEKVQSQVKNLHLENVQVTAGENSNYIGLLSGTNKGIIENCTATGSITDDRTQLPQTVYVGALIGCNENTAIPSKLVGGTDLLTATAGTDNPNDQVEGISAKLATFFAELNYPEDATSKPKRVLGGIAGYSASANIDQTMLWQDVSNSTAYKSTTEQAYRKIVVDKMYQMGTVEWTPSETLYYLKNDNPTHTHSNVFVAGRTYIGIPYVGGYSGTYERFMTQMQTEKDGDGRYVTVTGLEEVSTQKDGVWTGAMRYMGNNCSWAVGWAWAAVSNARTDKNYGGVQGTGADEMVPNENTTAKYGVLAVGGYQTLPVDLEKYPDGKNALDTQSIIALNGGAAGMAEYYAKASRGDAIVYDEYSYTKSTDVYKNEGAHVRLLAEDPVIIRNYKTTIDLQKSYVITHEQGDGLSDNRQADGTYERYNGYNVKKTSWRINHKYTLDVLLTEEAYKALREPGYQSKETWPGCGWGFVPVTMQAFTAESQKTPYYNEYTGDNAVVLPNQGRIYSNYWTISAQMIITDASGNEVYNKTSFLMDRKNNGYSTIKLDTEFPDSADNLTEGQTYYCTITAVASNGVKTTFMKGKEFTCPKQ